ncbi:MAG: DUF3168 domain-containing protein [Prevotellaceae bacterium]|nr:DUF3168 domain-containing protein [Prevotellaceae bacterium]
MSLLIGEYIGFALRGDEAVMKATKGRIYPVLAPMDGDVRCPYIVYASNGLTEVATKDGLCYDTVSVSVMTFGKSLRQAERLAELVRGAMMRAWGRWEELEEKPFQIQDQTMSGGNEDFDLAHDGYFLELTYTIETCVGEAQLPDADADEGEDEDTDN